MAKTATKTDKALTPCECGCGADSKSRFLPGHDAKLKSRLVTQAVEGSKEAEKQLADLGWSHFLDRKREILAEQAKQADANKSDAKPTRRSKTAGGSRK
jgi:hypothetical protein